MGQAWRERRLVCPETTGQRLPIPGNPTRNRTLFLTIALNKIIGFITGFGNSVIHLSREFQPTAFQQKKRSTFEDNGLSRPSAAPRSPERQIPVLRARFRLRFDLFASEGAIGFGDPDHPVSRRFRHRSGCRVRLPLGRSGTGEEK